MTIASIAARMPIEKHFVLNIIHLQFAKCALRRDVNNSMSIIAVVVSQSACGIVFVGFSCTFHLLNMLKTVTAPALSERLDKVRGRIEAAALRCNRAPNEITLVAVSKTHPV